MDFIQRQKGREGGHDYGWGLAVVLRGSREREKKPFKFRSPLGRHNEACGSLNGTV